MLRKKDGIADVKMLITFLLGGVWTCKWVQNDRNGSYFSYVQVPALRQHFYGFQSASWETHLQVEMFNLIMNGSTCAKISEKCPLSVGTFSGAKYGSLRSFCTPGQIHTPSMSEDIAMFFLGRPIPTVWGPQAWPYLFVDIWAIRRSWL